MPLQMQMLFVVILKLVLVLFIMQVFGANDHCAQTITSHSIYTDELLQVDFKDQLDTLLPAIQCATQYTLKCKFKFTP